MNIVFLPATAPDDDTYGTAPASVAEHATAAIHQVTFPHMVWYNAAVRQDAIAQIRAMNIAPVVLAGFSKSGLGAWNITREVPELVEATIIFDAPVTMNNLPPWGTAPYYADDAAWQCDLPLRTVEDFRNKVAPAHKLILISGSSFHEEMSEFAEVLRRMGISHTFLSRQDLRHHWQSGWIETGIDVLSERKS